MPISGSALRQRPSRSLIGKPALAKRHAKSGGALVPHRTAPQRRSPSFKDIAAELHLQHQRITGVQQQRLKCCTISFQTGARSDGAQGRDRTTDTAIFSRMLYQLSYLGTSSPHGSWERGFIVRPACPVHHGSPWLCAARPSWT